MKIAFYLAYFSHDKCFMLAQEAGSCVSSMMSNKQRVQLEMNDAVCDHVRLSRN